MKRLAQLREHLGEIQAAGIDVLIVLCQKRANVVQWLGKHPLPFPVLIDEDRSRAKAWGVYTLLSYDSVNIARPASFVVGPDGTVRYARVSRNQKDHAAVEEILGAVSQGEAGSGRA